jgi:hypothetical protein
MIDGVFFAPPVASANVTKILDADVCIMGCLTISTLRASW